MYECPEDISEQAICINGDIGAVIDELRKGFHDHKYGYAHGHTGVLP
jgi:hypothetical protein